MPLRNDDMQDRELLYAIEECSDAEGVCSRDVLMEYLKVSIRAASNRLSWMRRYGYIERVDPRELGGKRGDAVSYLITPMGRDLMGGRITAAMEKELDRDPGTQLLLMRELSRRGYVEADYTVASALRREWTANLGRRSK